MANEIYHRSNWGNAVNDIAWGDVYEKFDATNEMFVRSDNYENSNETDKLMAAINPKPSILLTPTAYDNGSLHSVKPVQSFGSELVTNGDFATDSDWNTNDWTISNGVATLTTTSTNNLNQNISITQNKFYQIVFTIKDLSNGGIRIRLGIGDLSNTITSNGTHTLYVQHTTTNNVLRIYSNSSGIFNGSIDNVSVKEVIDADFDFTRGTIATRIAENGLIEDVTDTNLPRIDYTDGTGSLLLEPQSTNTATYSNDFTQGDVFGGSGNPGVDAGVLTSQQAISPDGTNNAWLLKDNNSGGSGQPNLRFFSVSVTSNDFNTVSIFAKKALTNNFIAFSSAGFDSSGNGDSWFNISNGTLGTIDSNHTAKIEDYGNGWYRCQITFTTTTDTTGAIRIRLAVTDGSLSVTKDGTNGLYLFGLQCEASATQNYATSYIPTSGSTVTRNKDVCDNSGSSDLISSTEGVLYVEASALANDGTSRRISLNDGTSSNKVNIEYDETANRIRASITSGGSAQTLTYNATNLLQFNKIAVKYKQDDFAIWLNGVEVVTDTSGNAPIGLSELGFNNSGTSLPFYGKVKSVAVYKEALTDAQLTALTT